MSRPWPKLRNEGNLPPGYAGFRMTKSIRRPAYRLTRKDGATGINGVRARGLREKPRGQAVRPSGAHQVRPIEQPPDGRAYLPKPDGSHRPHGIPTFDDKVAQRRHDSGSRLLVVHRLPLQARGRHAQSGDGGNRVRLSRCHLCLGSPERRAGFGNDSQLSDGGCSTYVALS